MRTTQYSMPALVAALCTLLYSLFCFIAAGASAPPVFFNVVIVVVCLLMYKQTITVTDTDVCFVQGIGLIRGRYRFAIIQSCKPISYFVFGWGIRFYSDAILFNVSGNKAVELTFNNGKFTVWIGTKMPVEIAEYINKRLKTIDEQIVK